MISGGLPSALRADSGCPPRTGQHPLPPRSRQPGSGPPAVGSGVPGTRGLRQVSERSPQAPQRAGGSAGQSCACGNSQMPASHSCSGTCVERLAFTGSRPRACGESARDAASSVNSRSRVLCVPSRPPTPHFAGCGFFKYCTILCRTALYRAALHYTTFEETAVDEAGKVEAWSGRDGWTTCYLWEPWVHSRLKKPVPRR